MQIKLNARLLAVAKLVLYGQPAADIGTDHSYLPVYLIINGVCPAVIATEKARGPFNNACQLVELLSLNRKIDMRLGQGLTVLKPGEAATIIMAGIGGHVIRDILEASPEVTASSRRLVLQPQKNVPMLRQYLQQSSWRIVTEDIAFDHGFYYEVIVAEQGSMQLKEEEVLFGPCLLGQPHPLLPQYLGLQLADMQTLLDQLEGKAGNEAEERRAALQNRVRKIESILDAKNGG
jgi:tRNA (adenine22-N1)-methyltransferase